MGVDKINVFEKMVKLQGKSHWVIKYGMGLKSLVPRSIHVKHESPIHPSWEAIAKVKVFPDSLVDNMASKNISSCTLSYTALRMKTDLHF